VAYTHTGGLSESIVDGHTGALVDDLDAMVDTVDHLLASPAERERMGKAAKEHSAAFTWERTISAWETMLRHVVRRDQPVAGTDDAD
jgi:glycosyltransferase involved in cell wall biosynthesis